MHIISFRPPFQSFVLSFGVFSALPFCSTLTYSADSLFLLTYLTFYNVRFSIFLAHLQGTCVWSGFDLLSLLSTWNRGYVVIADAWWYWTLHHHLIPDRLFFMTQCEKCSHFRSNFFSIFLLFFQSFTQIFGLKVPKGLNWPQKASK